MASQSACSTPPHRIRPWRRCRSMANRSWPTRSLRTSGRTARRRPRERVAADARIRLDPHDREPMVEPGLVLGRRDRDLDGEDVHAPDRDRLDGRGQGPDRGEDAARLRPPTLRTSRRVKPSQTRTGRPRRESMTNSSKRRHPHQQADHPRHYGRRRPWPQDGPAPSEGDSADKARGGSTDEYTKALEAAQAAGGPRRGANRA